MYSYSRDATSGGIFEQKDDSLCKYARRSVLMWLVENGYALSEDVIKKHYKHCDFLDDVKLI